MGWGAQLSSCSPGGPSAIETLCVVCVFLLRGCVVCAVCVCGSLLSHHPKEPGAITALPWTLPGRSPQIPRAPGLGWLWSLPAAPSSLGGFSLQGTSASRAWRLSSWLGASSVS